jgi:hypothetical protein
MSTDTHGWTDVADRQLARSIFGTDERDVVVADWTVTQGFEPGHIRSIELSVGAGVTVDLPGGPPIFVKVWPKGTDRQGLFAQLAVQQAMAADGYPTSAILTDLSALGPATAVAMSYNRDGEPTDARIYAVCQHMARGLARFIARADSFCDTPELPCRRLPDCEAVWPPPHNSLYDFEATRDGAEWIDRVAKDALAIMRSASSHIIVGHHDWSAKNMRMGPDGISVLYDWDAVFLDRETFVLGSAAAHFPVTWELPVPETPTRGQMAAFIQDYAQARGTALARAELIETAAGATYARAYNERCEHSLDPKGVNLHGSSRGEHSAAAGISLPGHEDLA